MWSPSNPLKKLIENAKKKGAFVMDLNEGTALQLIKSCEVVVVLVYTIGMKVKLYVNYKDQR